MITQGCNDPKLGALMFAYEIGALSPEDEERFDRHVLECEHCFSQVKSFKDYAGMLRFDDGIRESLQAAGRATEESPEQPFGFWRYLWPSLPLPFRPALLYLVILLLLYPAFDDSLLYEPPAFEQAQTISLSPSRSTGQESFSLSASRTGIISFFYPGAKANSRYTVIIRNAEDAVVFADTMFTAFDAFETGWLVFPSERMQSGSYRLELNDPAKESANAFQVYGFDITE